MSFTKPGIYWASTDMSWQYEAIFLNKVQYQVDLERIPLSIQVEGLFTDFEVFSIPGLPEWNFWRRISGYRQWTAAVMPVSMVGMVFIVTQTEYVLPYINDKKYIEGIETILEHQRGSIYHYLKFAEYASVKPLLVCLAYEPFQVHDEKLIGSIPPEIPVLKYNLQEYFDFVRDFRAIFPDK